MTARSIDEARETAREQISAAWQLHIEKIQEALHAGWRESVDRIVDERFEEVRQHVQVEVEKQSAAQAVVARREFSAAMNMAVRRLRQFESEAQWCMALLDAAIGFCGRAALFHAGSQAFRFLTDRGPEAPGARPEEDIALRTAPALLGAMESAETMVTIRVASEVSPAIANYYGEDAEQRVYIFPVSTSARVVALLYAEPGERPADTEALEMLATVGGAMLESHLASLETKRPSNVVTITSMPLVQQVALAAHAPAPGPMGAGPSATSWSALSRDEQDAHLRAQRFARVRIAEMRLYKSAAVRAGREEQNLYGALREDIDAGRQGFKDQFLALSPATMLDYFHVELVRTLANDDPALLGPDYPGPLA